MLQRSRKTVYCYSQHFTTNATNSSVSSKLAIPLVICSLLHCWIYCKSLKKNLLYKRSKPYGKNDSAHLLKIPLGKADISNVFLHEADIVAEPQRWHMLQAGTHWIPPSSLTLSQAEEKCLNTPAVRAERPSRGSEPVFYSESAIKSRKVNHSAPVHTVVWQDCTVCMSFPNMHTHTLHCIFATKF